ncbi:MAG: putative M18 family aminopeptidase 1 [Firmicutes bacterium ADurb.Bin300]|jgi:aspartyl aminopeptidase|nr:MAG: putative M18 family aminopeptidase 1 [Firmicutes bacterium ADurb.Bin300]
MEKKDEAKALLEKLAHTQKNAVLTLDDKTVKQADKFCVDYMKYLDSSKTEREAVSTSEQIALKAGFKRFNPDEKYSKGDRVYVNNRGKAMILAVIGSRPVKNGVRIAAAHIDSPRLDLKPNPLYEADELALFKTHYYGGIKKYQWTAIPLALHGVIVKKDQSVVSVNIGEDDGDFRFVISDLLPHLSAEQLKRTLAEGIKGEELNVLIGSRPFRSDEGSELVKLNILKILNEKYGITETDFLSAELEIVPAFKASDIGFDRSMIGSYGHDDRVCAYPALMAAVNAKNPEYTVISVLADKEEIGSEGNTGLVSRYFENFVNDLGRAEGIFGYEILRNSKCLSADVNAAFDPTFPDVAEKKNFAFINRGVVITKYTGSRGKGGTSDASAEYLGEIRAILDGAGIVWQTGELGKVDAGGGGTVAKYIAALDVDVVDVGVPVLSMHAPFEVVSKIDVYMAYKAFESFFK